MCMSSYYAYELHIIAEANWKTIELVSTNLISNGDAMCLIVIIFRAKVRMTTNYCHHV